MQKCRPFKQPLEQLHQMPTITTSGHKSNHGQQTHLKQLYICENSRVHLRRLHSRCTQPHSRRPTAPGTAMASPHAAAPAGSPAGSPAEPRAEPSAARAEEPDGPCSAWKKKWQAWEAPWSRWDLLRVIKQLGTSSFPRAIVRKRTPSQFGANWGEDARCLP